MSKIEHIHKDQEDIASTIVMECLREIFHQIPKGHEFTLSNGKKATTKTFFEPRHHPETGVVQFGMDIKIEDFSLDHIEFCMSHTGHGGPLSEPVIDED